MPDALGDDEDVPGAQHHRVASLELHPEGAVPAQVQLVLVALMPGERPLESRDPQHAAVREGEITRLPRVRQLADGGGDRDRGCGSGAHAHSFYPERSRGASPTLCRAADAMRTGQP